MTGALYIADLILAILYFILFCAYFRIFVSGHRPIGRLSKYALPVVLGLHAVKLLHQGFAEGHCPVEGFSGALSFTAFALALIYLIVERRHRYFGTGVIFMGIITVFQAFSFVATRNVNYLPPEFPGTPLGIHASLALLGFAALATSAIYSVVYLVMNHMLKKKHLGANLREIPPLETIEKMQIVSAAIGIIVVILAIIMGVVVAAVYKIGVSLLDMKVLLSIVIVGVFVYGVVGSHWFSFSGKKRSVVALAGFLLAVVSMIIARFLPTFHRF